MAVDQDREVRIARARAVKIEDELKRRGITVDLATDARGGRYGGKFPARQIHIIPSETVRGRNPIALARTGMMLGLGFAKALRVLGRVRPAAVVGFGGYPTLPPLMAARLHVHKLTIVSECVMCT
jgi:UDP-N-acetylglucosamine--N-acetylmuramyl-(pentapeptide) pyrophosphoryl-undecaprenol N-acetylglucosamine transferase